MAAHAFVKPKAASRWGLRWGHLRIWKKYPNIYQNNCSTTSNIINTEHWTLDRLPQITFYIE
jgi:hypothetical protein